MDIVVVGSADFTLGFQLAGLDNLHNPADDEECAQTLRGLLNENLVAGMPFLSNSSDFSREW